jgi:hypothetical protein
MKDEELRCRGERNEKLINYEYDGMPNYRSIITP